MSWRDHLPIHPAAELFPLMSEDELRELADDIKKRGLVERISLWFDQERGENVLLDGRKRITAFGSYITAAADLGDIDIAVELECKVPAGQKLKANQARAKASGRKNLPYFEEETFGELEVNRLLKGRNPYISLILYDSLERLNTPTRVIYPRLKGWPQYQDVPEIAVAPAHFGQEAIGSDQEGLH